MNTSAISFNHSEVFSRTIGWISQDEMEILRTKHIAIGGVGGTGGYYALTLARLGIEHFSLADSDTFSLTNMNRQAGAFLNTLGKNKAQVVGNMLLDINPNISIKTYDNGVTESNIDEFLSGADFYLNAMGLSSVDIQTAIFEACRGKNIPGTSVIVPGFGASLINFHPRKMSFQQYFQAKGYKREEQAIRLLVGHNPRLLMRHYILSDDPVRFKEYDGPVIPMSCLLAAGTACTQVLKILLKRKGILWAPWSSQVDAYLGKYVNTLLPFGNNNIIQRLVLKYMRRRFKLPRSYKKDKSN